MDSGISDSSPTKPDAGLLILYGHILGCSSYNGALGYYARAALVKPKDPLGFNFLYEYYELKGKNQEAEYNLGHAFHQLGLTHLAIPHYEKALKLPSVNQILKQKIDKKKQLEIDENDEVEHLEENDPTDIRKEAVYNLYLNYMETGSSALAQMLLKKYYAIWKFIYLELLVALLDKRPIPLSLVAPHDCKSGLHGWNLFHPAYSVKQRGLDNLITIHEKWHSILGEELPLIEPHDYVKLSKILAPPKLTAHEMNGSVAYVLHYIRQKVKMWGADVLRAENIKTLVEEYDDVSDEESESSDLESMDEGQDVRKNQLSRFDCLASLLASVECTVAQDIFRTLSQFPVALPLTIPELDKEEMFKVMLPLLVGPVIKWETKPGTIVENHLFNDRFRLIVAIRIGTNSPGKSVILNQLMASDSMFSSSCEPRAEYGIPHMINGSIEFTWLNQETCGVSMWNDVFENYYKEGAKEIALLANLHGDALDHPDQIKFLRQLPSSFLVFLMPGCTASQIDKLEDLIGPKKIIYGWVNKKNTDKKKYTIDTKFLMKDKTLKKVRMMFKEALDFDTSSFNARIKLRGSLQLTEGIELAESQLLADFVKEKTCRHIKLEVMQLQRKPPNDLQIWKNNTELQYLILLYINILKLPLNKRIRALAHLEREVSRLSMIESSGVRNQAVLKREELRLEHFFRELGQIYKISSINDPDSEIVLKLPELYAQLLIGGHTVELLDGDAGSISEAWFSAICGHICNAYPRLRIFVVSILGLQSSGKSTLLNALFACRFAVSVGRCTRGLFMRLLFLEKNLSDQLGVDAFVLIDTEGLGAPEKMDDPESEKKDRILATFAMGVSNLTILNVLGESTRDLTEILQIAIVTMARLEEAGIAPDIMMVQHVSERNAARLSEPEEKFRAALQEALKIAKEQDIEMGISNTDCLQILDERIKKGQLLKQFRPFKNGATAYAPPSEQYHEDVVNLYNSIINDCKNSQSKIEFSKWHSLIQDYWNAVSHEDFAVRFKNIREIYEFIDLGKRITKLKETIDKAFLKHEESIMQKVRTKLQSWSPNDRSNMNLRHQCLELIEKGLQKIPDCNDAGCEECERINKERIELEEYLKDKNNEMCEIETKQTIEDYIKLNRHSASIKLTQMLDASFIRKGISSESLDIINNRLEGILRNMPSGRRLTEYQRKKEVEEIWSLLRNNILSKYNIKPIVDQIDKEVKDACSHLSSVGFYQQYMNGDSPDLSKCKAYKAYRGLIPTCLDIRDVCTLQEKLNNLVDSILEKRASYHYYPGIVRDLAKVIEKTLNDNANLLRVKFLPEFKWNAYLYALLKFKPKMISFQKKWEMDNTPLGILDQKKEEYLKMIDTRLQYGHTLVSEGHIAGDYLLRVIHKKAMDAGSAERKTAVRNIGWLTCTESVRLKYFENLAEQVQRGDKKEAIEHFSWPKGSIEYWFKCKVDGNTSGNPKQKYNDTFNSEFNRVVQEIRNCQSFGAIKKFINNYMTQVDKVDYKLDLRDTKDEDFRIFYHAVEEELKTKGGGRYPKDEPFQDPSKDKSIMELLGCTEACYFCGALCWGSQGHYNDSGETKRHHTSHQPGGLARFSYRGSKELVAMPCHKLEDHVGVWYFGKEDPTPWSVVKAQDFKDWRFESHYQHLFNDLMCWFFEKLHVDLANKYGLKPSTYNEMSKYGCINLSYSDIISTLRTKL
nr:7996_t:CDS:2 [Entrophospora candida]